MNKNLTGKKVDYDKMVTLLREYGMDYKRAKRFVERLIDDEKSFQTDEHTKKWALERGFYPGRVELYGLTDENYMNFMPDFSYFMIQPINHHFRIWINDKLTLKYILNSCGCEDSMPEYYLYIENDGSYTYLMDSPIEIAKDTNYLFNLLKYKKSLAVKPNSGTSGGRGFMKWEYKEGELFVNNEKISLERFNEITQNLQNYIVTEYVRQHSALSKIWSLSECTLRVIMVKLPNKKFYQSSNWYNILSYARFGTKISGGASNLSSGGIGIGFDYNTGKFNDLGTIYKKFCTKGNYLFKEHPDTHISLKNNFLPNWNYVKNMIERVCEHISSLDYLGFDVIITEEGMKFCEINSGPDLSYEHIICGPILSDPLANLFFVKHGLNKVNTNSFFEIYQKCVIE